MSSFKTGGRFWIIFQTPAFARRPRQLRQRPVRAADESNKSNKSNEWF
ncbi:MAG: hypothetical protein LBU81_03535 [Methanosarcinales archaeon]|nr:hypothetical protein [Methanosarcinales archaeon]